MTSASKLALSERTRVRVISRASAVIIALGCIFLASLRTIDARAPAGQFGPPAISVAYIALERPETAPRVVRRAEARDGAVAVTQEASAPAGGEGEGLRLWLDGDAGRIVFDDPAQYRRCLEARLAHVESSDCPGARSARPLALSENTRSPGLIIERRRSPSHNPR